MRSRHINIISTKLDISAKRVEAVADLLDQEATVPFIARYRKEATDSLDEVQITAIRDGLAKLTELDNRRETILNSLEKNGYLTDELKDKVMAADTMAVLEDVYLPFKPKRRTKAIIARAKGLAPLAEDLLPQSGTDPIGLARAYVDPEKGVADTDEALEGARHIIAELVNEDETARGRLRELFEGKAVIRSQVIDGKQAQGQKYKDYFEWHEPASQAPSHRILAMRRGEREDILSLSIYPPEDEALEILEGLFVSGDGGDSEQVRLAVHDSYKRLLGRSLETEARVALKEKADAEAIHVFADNLRELLLAPPLGAKRVMGIDPGFRTGCKVVCLDRQGKLLEYATIYPHSGSSQARQAGDTIRQLCARLEIEAVAVGNGTAGRETEGFVRDLGLADNIAVLMVNESGASVYSASQAARDEFPDHDVTVRGAVSIGRRLMDPLAELVKIDPKSIGVGQYQHDVDQSALKASLDDVVISCVNAVGVDVNRASMQLLTCVSGLGPQLARNIVVHRDAKGPFITRTDLLEVPRLGPKAFEQAAGFLRIPNGGHPLDASAVHPESYLVANAMAADLGCTIEELMHDAQLRRRIDIQRYVSDTVGVPTLTDIVNELAKPGRDPRDQFEVFAFAGHVSTMADLQPGMQLPGIVTNVTKFGAFVDVGVHQDGLVHISELADRFVKNPSDVVKVQQKVMVTVLDADLDRKRISLSMRGGTKTSRPANGGGPAKPRDKKRPDRKKPIKSSTRNSPQPFHNPFAESLKQLRKKQKGE